VLIEQTGKFTVPREDIFPHNRQMSLQPRNHGGIMAKVALPTMSRMPRPGPLIGRVTFRHQRTSPGAGSPQAVSGDQAAPGDQAVSGDQAAPDSRPNSGCYSDHFSDESSADQSASGDQAAPGKAAVARSEARATRRQSHPIRHQSHPTRRPSQVMALAIGLLLVVVGGIVVAQTGLHIHHLGAHTRAVGMEASTLWGLVELGIGAVLLTAGLRPAMVRGPMVFFGVALLAFGVIVVVEPTSFRDPLAVTRRTGALDMVLGVALLGTTIVIPPVIGMGRRWLSRRHPT